MQRYECIKRVLIYLGFKNTDFIVVVSMTVCKYNVVRVSMRTMFVHNNEIISTHGETVSYISYINIPYSFNFDEELRTLYC